ncbi:MAG: sigma-70 family RNA polymerase sigma factor [Anaerolineales bacterium]
MNYSKLDDEVLIRLIEADNGDSMGELYDRYSRLVFSLARNIVGDPGTAEEITLDVFTLIWEKAGTYNPEKAKVRTWMTTITRNRSIDELRRRGSRPERIVVDLFQDPSSQLLVDNSLEDDAQASLNRERVREAVSQLPDDQKEALQLAYFKGYTHRQIADLLDQPLGTIKTRIRLAMGKLRNILLEEEHINER